MPQEISQIQPIEASRFTDSSTPGGLDEARHALSQPTSVRAERPVAPGSEPQTLDLGADRNLYPNAAPEATSPEKAKLLSDYANYNESPAAAKRFAADIHTFEARAKKDGLTSEQKAATYKQLDQLFTDSGKQPVQLRVALAGQVASQLARPESIRQGGYGTCGSADTEVITYQKHPEAAVGLVAQVALAGKYKAADGSGVTVSAHPTGESVANGLLVMQPGPHVRSYASQIFQTTVMNMALSQRDYAKTHEGAQQAQYVQDNIGGAVVYKDKNGVPQRDNTFAVNTDEQARIYQSITADKDVRVLSHDAQAGADGPTPTFNTQGQLEQLLAQAKGPQMIRVNVDNAPFDQEAQRDCNYLDSADLGHMVVIQSQSADGKLQIYNTQGQDVIFGQGGQISSHDLYLATLSRKEEIVALQADLKAAPDNHEELELTRLELEEKTIKPSDAAIMSTKIVARMTEAERSKNQPVIDLLLLSSMSSPDRAACVVAAGK